jgi:MerR family transcriptional regulator, light-induced transcriptional regulator
VNEPQGGLAIGELARRTEVPAATLRSWETRYGFPRHRRLAGGHRRYDEREIALIEEVLRLRASGMSLQAAIGQAVSRAADTEPSVFAGLRRRHPDLVPQVFRKAMLLALTWAMEDESCARAERATIFGSFQRQRFYRRSEQRWNELARTAQVVVAFADFDGSPGDWALAGAAPSAAGPGGLSASSPGAPPAVRAPLKVQVPADAPLRREWTLVCDAPDYPACVAGWEFPGQQETSDADRRFEVLWTVDPQVVRDAATICAQLAESWSPRLGPLLSRLPSGPAPAASADLQRAMGLLNRMTGYIEGATRA